MFEKRFLLNDNTIPIIDEIGKHMPGGFFIYKAEKPEELLYANKAVFDIFGCNDIEDFKNYTGYTFKGMVYPDDYSKITASIEDQIEHSEENLDYVVYRIKRKDGKIRWVDDYGHYAETAAYGGIYYVFISDITEKHEKTETDLATRNAVIEALSNVYNTVWLINDTVTESISLYQGDLEGDSIHVSPNKAALQFSKYSDAMNYYIANTVAEEDHERLYKELSLAHILPQLENRHQITVNYLRQLTDGNKKYYRVEFAKANMPNGRFGIVCGFKDVDEDVRKGREMQKKLREAEIAKENNRRLVKEVESAAKLAELMGSVASLLSNMPAMSFSKDAETGVYLACNQSFAEYAHKKSPEEVIGHTDYDIFDKKTADHFVSDDKKALNMDKPYVFFENVPNAARTEIRNLQTTKLKFTDATGKLCTLGMCVDVTEISRIKETEAKKIELEKRLALQDKLLKEESQRARQEKMITALASDYKSVYYVELDTNEGICYQPHSDLDESMKAGEHFDYLKTFTDYANKYVTPQYLKDFLNFIQPESIKDGLKEERVISYRYTINRGGKESYEMVRFAGVRHPEDRDDHLVHAVGACFTDVDAETRRTLNQSRALGEALTAAEEASKAKTVFLSNMSHEIRTPMNAIIGLDNIALNDPDISDKTREYLEKINSSANHLLNIINDILDMSRIESGRMTLKNEDFSISDTLEQVSSIIGGQCRDKGLEYRCRIIGDINEYYIGDDMKLRQIMINILGNAVKFTEKGGIITFHIERIAQFDGKSTLRFTISDTGIGMSKEYLPKIFDPFSQENSHTTNKYGSTGLGMPITKSMVELMNGQISVESEKGKGTTFTVTVTLGDSSQRSEKYVSESISAEELKVLVIDDDEIACEHAQLILNQVGITCDTVLSGDEGVKIIEMHHARRTPYNLILVDWKMPKMDGIETTKKIRKIIGDESTVIILTSYNWDEIIDEAKNAGVDSFVSKPLFATALLDEFKEVYNKKHNSFETEKADLNGRRILIAEDMEVNAEIMVMVLSMRNMQVDIAENGKIAVELFNSSEIGYYDAILMDMRMPVMDGLEATRTIRSLQRDDAKTIPIIALTANAFDEDVQRSMQEGLNAHLSKPVQPEVLFETLENFIK